MNQDEKYNKDFNEAWQNLPPDLQAGLFNIIKELARQNKLIDRLKALVKYQKEYTEVIVKEYQRTMGVAYVHGYEANKQDVIKGEKMRNAMSELEKQIKRYDAAEDDEDDDDKHLNETSNLNK
jgi:hypothetical protein